MHSATVTVTVTVTATVTAAVTSAPDVPSNAPLARGGANNPRLAAAIPDGEVRAIRPSRARRRDPCLASVSTAMTTAGLPVAKRLLYRQPTAPARRPDGVGKCREEIALVALE